MRTEVDDVSTTIHILVISSQTSLTAKWPPGLSPDWLVCLFRKLLQTLVRPSIFELWCFISKMQDCFQVAFVTNSVLHIFYFKFSLQIILHPLRATLSVLLHPLHPTLSVLAHRLCLTFSVLAHLFCPTLSILAALSSSDLAHR